MRKFFFGLAIISCCCFLTGMASVNNYSPEVNAAYEQLKNDVAKRGVDVKQVTDSAKPIKDLLAQGVRKDDLKKFVLDLYNKKLDEPSFKSSLTSVSELMKDGEAYRKARNLVTSGIDKAKAQGLTGVEFKNKINETIEARKNQLDEIKKQCATKAQQMKEGVNKYIEENKGKSFMDMFKGITEPEKKAASGETISKPEEKQATQEKIETTNTSEQSQACEGVVDDINSRITPVLNKVFGGARIIAQSSSSETKIDGEVVENRITYKVNKNLIPEDGNALHAAFREAGFSRSPRLGAKPTIWSGGAAMSFFESTSQRSYSFVINIDTRKQQIVVESYRLGSKYDRLM